MSKKNKFDLTSLVHHKFLTDGQKLYFVSDNKVVCSVARTLNGEYKVIDNKKEVYTLHNYAAKCLGTEPPDHASKWFKTESGKTLYELWQMDLEHKKAA